MESLSDRINGLEKGLSNHLNLAQQIHDLQTAIQEIRAFIGMSVTMDGKEAESPETNGYHPEEKKRQSSYVIRSVAFGSDSDPRYFFRMNSKGGIPHSMWTQSLPNAMKFNSEEEAVAVRKLLRRHESCSLS